MSNPVEVRVPDEPPELSPEAARILLRILLASDARANPKSGD